MYRDNALRIVCTPRVADFRAYDLLAFFFLDRPFSMPPRRIDRFLGLDFDFTSWEEEATTGEGVTGGFLFLR
jgi:hypothetical protein